MGVDLPIPKDDVKQWGSPDERELDIGQPIQSPGESQQEATTPATEQDGGRVKCNFPCQSPQMSQPIC